MHRGTSHEFVSSFVSFIFFHSFQDINVSLIPNAAYRDANYYTIFVRIYVMVVWELDVALCMFCSTFVKIHVSAALEICVSQLGYETTISLRRPMVK